MISNGNEKVIDYFLSELQSLRKRAVQFSQDYSEVADELRLGGGRSDDPHVEMLLQSFAYLTARLRYNLDSDLPEIPTNLLRHLYPHLETPLPSMAVVQLDPFPESVDFKDGYPLKRGRQFKRQVTGRDNLAYDCYLRTAQDTELWPIKIVQAQLQPTNRFEQIELLNKDVRSVLHLRLQTTSDIEFSELNLERLRLFINSALGRSCFRLYDRLHRNLNSVIYRGSEKSDFKTADISWLGFEPSHAILPYSKRSHPGYRLLQEYFAFPEKFMFFEINSIQSTDVGNQLDLYFLFDVDLSNENILSDDSLLLNCVPTINLFHTVTEPVRLNQREFEYLLIPDVRQYRACEIHSINKVVGTDVQGRSTEIPAFLPERDIYRMEQGSDYWSSRRDYPELKRFPGTETFISFHDQRFNVSLPATESIYAEVTCTNRDVVRNMRPGTSLRLVGEGPANEALLVTKPTRYQEPAVRGKQPWELVSQLTLNFASLSGSLNRPDSANGFARENAGQTSQQENVLMVQNLLRMYSDADNLNHQSLVDSIINIQAEPSVAHTGLDAWRGFTQGMAITLLVDESRLDHTSVYLMSEILHRFFALYTTVNSFVSLTLFSIQRDEAIKTWPPLMGERALL